MEVDTTPPQQGTNSTLVSNDIMNTNGIIDNITENVTENIIEQSSNDENTKNPEVKETKPEHKIPSDYDNRMLWMKGVLENGFSYEHEIAKKEKQVQENILNDKQRYYTDNNPEEISIFEECLERNNRENYNKLKKFLNNEMNDLTMLIFYTEEVTVENEVAKKHLIKHKRSRFLPKEPEPIVEPEPVVEEKQPEIEDIKKTDAKKKGKNEKTSKITKKAGDKKTGTDKKIEKKTDKKTDNKNEGKKEIKKEEPEIEEKTEEHKEEPTTEENKQNEIENVNGEEQPTVLPPNI